VKLTAVTINDFKAIKSASIELTDATMLVGANNSGKSSILQAIHLAARTIALADEANKPSTLSLSDAEYLPSEMYRELGHRTQWGNYTTSPGSTITFTFVDPTDGGKVDASVTLRSARNEGISVSPALPPKAIPILRGKDTIFSAYIPGIAGIPLSENLLSTRHVYRKAASGDSNVVLRNILWKIKQSAKLDQLLEYIRDVYPDVSLNVTFDDEADFVIAVTVDFGGGSGVNKPLEFSGAGFIHVLQIFSYLVLFKPKIMLIDEPESHLHPTLQTRLVRQLQKRVKENDAFALITTHSPFVARGLPLGSRSVWISRGEVAASGADDAIRTALGWGAIDKRVLLCTEDALVGPLRTLIEQRETLIDRVAVFPFSGVSTLGSGASLKRFAEALGSQHKTVVHRDRDCLSDTEAEPWKDEYKNHGHIPWLTDGSDLEMYFCEAEYVAAALEIDVAAAQAMIETAIQNSEEKFKQTFARKRGEINKKLYEKTGGSPVTDDLWANLPVQQRVRGKDLLSALREQARAAGYDEKRLGRPANGFVCAKSLIQVLENVT